MDLLRDPDRPVGWPARCVLVTGSPLPVLFNRPLVWTRVRAEARLRRVFAMDLIIEVLALISFDSLIVSWLVLPASMPMELPVHSLA
jgi:hypothetical protein